MKDNKVYANLHLHSTHSDGYYSPTELVKIAKEEGYKAVALTDHDTVTGNEEMRLACESEGLEWLFGIELTCKSDLLNGKKFHMTAFGFDAAYPPLAEYLSHLSETEAHQTEVLVERALKLGLIKDITWDEIREYNKGITWLCNEHVFRAMRAKGLITDAEYPQFFDDCFGKHRREVPNLYDFKYDTELIPMIHKAGGIIILAHPHNQLHLVPELIKRGIDGIEYCHTDLTDEEMIQAREIGLKYGIYLSGGTDHSGLCSGLYRCYEKPEECPYYCDPLSIGSAKEFFDEMKQKKIAR